MMRRSISNSLLHCNIKAALHRCNMAIGFFNGSSPGTPSAGNSRRPLGLFTGLPKGVK